MRILVTILVIIVGLVVLMLVTALFVKKDYSIARQIVINRPSSTVFNYIKYLKNQDYFSKWVMFDPNMKKNFIGMDGTVGFIYAWDSENKNTGKGEQEIKKITEGERIDLEIRFIKPFEGIAQVPFITKRISDNQTEVTWGMSGRSKYPMNIMNLFMEKMLGKDLEQSLTTLKGILEDPGMRTH